MIKFVAAAAVVAVALGACSSATPHASRHLPSPATTPAAGTPVLTGIALHRADLRNVTVPGSACLQTHPIDLHAGVALIADKRGNPTPYQTAGRRYLRLTASLDFITFGHFEAADVSDAAVPLMCDNNGGTADGALLYSLAIFSGRSGSPRFLGLVTPRRQPAGVLPTIIGGDVAGEVRMSPGRLRVVENFYGPNDPTCCMTGRAITTWTHRNGRLAVLSTKVTKNPT